VRDAIIFVDLSETHPDEAGVLLAIADAMNVRDSLSSQLNTHEMRLAVLEKLANNTGYLIIDTGEIIPPGLEDICSRILECKKMEEFRIVVFSREPLKKARMLYTVLPLQRADALTLITRQSTRFRTNPYMKEKTNHSWVIELAEACICNPGLLTMQADRLQREPLLEPDTVIDELKDIRPDDLFKRVAESLLDRLTQYPFLIRAINAFSVFDGPFDENAAHAMIMEIEASGDKEALQKVVQNSLAICQNVTSDSSVSSLKAAISNLRSQLQTAEGLDTAPKPTKDVLSQLKDIGILRLCAPSTDKKWRYRLWSGVRNIMLGRRGEGSWNAMWLQRFVRHYVSLLQNPEVTGIAAALRSFDADRANITVAFRYGKELATSSEGSMLFAELVIGAYHALKKRFAAEELLVLLHSALEGLSQKALISGSMPMVQFGSLPSSSPSSPLPSPGTGTRSNLGSTVDYGSSLNEDSNKARLYTLIGILETDSRNFESGKNAFEDAVNCYEDDSSQKLDMAYTMAQYGRLLVKMATEANNQGNILENEAETKLRSALEGYTSLSYSFKREQLEKAECECQLADLLKKKSKWSEADGLYKSALETRRKYLSENSWEIAEILNDLGVLHSNQPNNVKSAEAYLQEALSIRTKLVREGHPGSWGELAMARTYKNLGNLYKKKTVREYNKAKMFYEECLVIHRRVRNERSKWQDGEKWQVEKEEEPVARMLIDLLLNHFGEEGTQTALLQARTYPNILETFPMQLLERLSKPKRLVSVMGDMDNMGVDSDLDKLCEMVHKQTVYEEVATVVIPSSGRVTGSLCTVLFVNEDSATWAVEHGIGLADMGSLSCQYFKKTEKVQGRTSEQKAATAISDRVEKEQKDDYRKSYPSLKSGSAIESFRRTGPKDDIPTASMPQNAPTQISRFPAPISKDISLLKSLGVTSTGIPGGWSPPAPSPSSSPGMRPRRSPSSPTLQGAHNHNSLTFSPGSPSRDSIDSSPPSPLGQGVLHGALGPPEFSLAGGSSRTDKGTGKLKMRKDRSRIPTAAADINSKGKREQQPPGAKKSGKQGNVTKLKRSHSQRTPKSRSEEARSNPALALQRSTSAKEDGVNKDKRNNKKEQAISREQERRDKSQGRNFHSLTEL